MASNNTDNQNRAEELRKRRSQRSQQRISTVSNRVVNPVNPRPVIVRGSGFGTPIHRQAGTKARRQFYITMDPAAGTELRLPPISLANPGWRMLSGLLAAVAALAVFSIFNSPFFRINLVDVRGLQRVNSQDLADALNLENLSIIEINRDEVQQKVTETFPELVNVQVAVDLPNHVTITAGERQPILAWQKGDQVSWIDSQGIVFPVRGEAGVLVTIHSDDDPPAAPAPITTTELDEAGEASAGAEAERNADAKIKETPRQVDPTLLSAAQALSQKLPPETTLVFSALNGLGWNDPQGYQVFIGRDLSTFDAKYNMYQQIASALSEQGLQPVLISVEQLNAPFYRLEQ